ncbi:YybS family protein [Clostridiaceae bacterium 35-E11]
MNIQNKTRAMIEAALMVAITCVFGIIGTYIPVLTFILFFIPVPFIILGKRHGMSFTVLSIIASAMIIGSFTEPIYSIFVVVLPGVTAIVMGYMMKKEYSPSKILIGGALAALISSLLSIRLGSLISGVEILSHMSEVFEEMTNMQIGMYKSMGVGEENLQNLEMTLEATRKLAMMIVPSAIILSSAFLAYINYVLTIHILRRIGYKVETLPPLRYFRLPRSILMGTFLIAGLTMAARYFGFANYTTLVLNVFFIFQFIYLIQGLAVMSYFMISYRFAKPLRIFIYLFLLLSQRGAFIVATIGFIDAFVNLRKLKIDQ